MFHEKTAINSLVSFNWSDLAHNLKRQPCLEFAELLLGLTIVDCSDNKMNLDFYSSPTPLMINSLES